MLEVDAINLSTAFKLQALGVQADPERYLVPGGSLVTPVLFSRVASGDLGALESLAGTPLGPAASARDLAALERGLRRALLDKALQGGRDTLGAGMALAYIREKEWEAARVRLLARRAFYGLPVAAIEKEVFL
jgi:V/A-type H+-transporting ATPase subunit C